jgi:hypothetical protein
MDDQPGCITNTQNMAANMPIKTVMFAHTNNMKVQYHGEQNAAMNYQNLYPLLVLETRIKD